MTPEKEITTPLWFSVSSSAKIGGVDPKTIRRALKSDSGLKYKIIKDRYKIELGSLLIFLNKNTKLKNKLNKNGLGQYL
jgi:hypothetical protein